MEFDDRVEKKINRKYEEKYCTSSRRTKLDVKGTYRMQVEPQREAN